VNKNSILSKLGTVFTFIMCVVAAVLLWLYVNSTGDTEGAVSLGSTLSDLGSAL